MEARPRRRKRRRLSTRRSREPSSSPAAKEHTDTRGRVSEALHVAKYLRLSEVDRHSRFADPSSCMEGNEMDAYIFAVVAGNPWLRASGSTQPKCVHP